MLSQGGGGGFKDGHDYFTRDCAAQAEDTKKGKIELAPNPNSTPESFLTFNGSKEPK